MFSEFRNNIQLRPKCFFNELLMQSYYVLLVWEPQSDTCQPFSFSLVSSSLLGTDAETVWNSKAFSISPFKVNAALKKSHTKQFLVPKTIKWSFHSSLSPTSVCRSWKKNVAEQRHDEQLKWNEIIKFIILKAHAGEAQKNTKSLHFMAFLSFWYISLLCLLWLDGDDWLRGLLEHKQKVSDSLSRGKLEINS